MTLWLTYVQGQETGLLVQSGTEPRPLVEILVELMGLELEAYHKMIQAWYELHLMLHPLAVKWWMDRKHDWLYQRALFKSNTPADGLELWAVSVALGLHLMVVNESSIWSSWPSGLDYGDKVVMYTTSGMMFCDWELQDVNPDTSGSTVGALLDFLEEEMMPSGTVGHPQTVEHPCLSASEAASA